MDRIDSFRPAQAAWQRHAGGNEQTPLLGASSSASNDRRVAVSPRGALFARMHAYVTSPVAQSAAFALAGGVSAGFTAPLLARASANSGPLAAASIMQAGGALFCSATRWAVPQTGAPITVARGRALVFLAGTALTGSVVNPGVMSLALKSASAASVTLTLNIEPFIASALAWPIYGERPGVQRLAACGAVIGSIVLCTLGELHDAPTSGVGIGLAAVAASAAAAADLSFYGLREFRSQDVVGSLALVAMVGSGALAIITNDKFPDARHSAMLVGTGASAFGVGNTLFALALTRGGVGRTTLISGITALTTGTGVSCALGQGTFTPFLGASLALALLGVVVLSFDEVREAAPADVHDVESQR